MRSAAAHGLGHSCDPRDYRRLVAIVILILIRRGG
jgi:hypothetical protein